MENYNITRSSFVCNCIDIDAYDSWCIIWWRNSIRMPGLRATSSDVLFREAHSSLPIVPTLTEELVCVFFSFFSRIHVTPFCVESQPPSHYTEIFFKYIYCMLVGCYDDNMYHTGYLIGLLYAIQMTSKFRWPFLLGGYIRNNLIRKEFIIDLNKLEENTMYTFIPYYIVHIG